ncbi:MAG: AsmA-like C-terminal domain-containing protein [Thermodesulfobacteriota bacterium]
MLSPIEAASQDGSAKAPVTADSAVARPAASSRPLWRRIAAGLLVASLAMIAFLGGVVCYLRVGMDGNRVARLVKPYVENATGLKISFVSAQLSWVTFLRARLTLNGLKAGAEGLNSSYLYAPVAAFEVDLAPLPAGALVVSHAQFSGPLAILAPPAESDKPTEPPIPPTPLNGKIPVLRPILKSLDVRDGKIIAAASSTSEVPEEVLFDRVTFRLRGVTPQGVDAIEAQGNVVSGSSVGAFTISGRGVGFHRSPLPSPSSLSVRLSHCPASPFRRIAYHLGHEFPLARGSIELHTTGACRQGKCLITGELDLAQGMLEPGSLFLKEVPVDQARGQFSLEWRPDSVHAQVNRLELPGLTAVIEAKAEAIRSSDPFAIVAVRQAQLDLEKLFPLLPLKLFSPEDRERVAATGATGRISVTGGVWNGKISDLHDAREWQKRLVLDAILEGVSGFVPRLGLRVGNAKGRIRLTSDEVGCEKVSLTLENAAIVANGWVRDLRGSPTADLFLSVKADGGDLQSILANNAVTAQLPTWSQRITQPGGGISATLDVKGSLSKPIVNGRIVLDAFRCGIRDFPLSLSEVRGTVAFEKSGASLSGVRGLIGGSIFQVAGDISESKLDLTTQLGLLFHDVKKIRAVPPGWTYSGRLPVVIALGGTPADATFSAGLDLTHNHLQLGKLVGKKTGVGLTIKAAGSRTPQMLRVDELSLVLGASTVTAKGIIDRNDRVEFAVNLPPKGLETGSLRQIVHPSLNLQSGGRFEGDLLIKGDPKSWDHLKLRADLRLRHVSLHVPGFRHSFQGVTADVQWRGRSVHVTVARAKLGSSEFAGSWAIQGYDIPKIEVQTEFPFLDTTDFAGPPETAALLTWPEWIRTNPVVRFVARGSLKGVLKVAKGKTRDRPFSDFRGTYEGIGGVIKVPSWEVKVADGIVTGSGAIDVRADTKEPLSIEWNAEKARLERALLSDPERMSIDGNLSAKGNLRWKTTDRRETQGLNKIGEVNVVVTDGTIHKFEILSKIFTLVNLGSILRFRFPDIVSQGLPYQRLTWTMDIFDHKWKISHLKLISDAARIDADGMYFTDQNRIDFRVSVSPLVGIDKILSEVFGNLLTKDGRTLTTTFRVRGLFGSPDVRLEPFDTFRFEP